MFGEPAVTMPETQEASRVHLRSRKLPITAIVATKDEAANLRNCLCSLSRAERVIVVDSASTDDTPGIARELGAEVIQFQYQGGYPKKRQWVLDNQGISTPWAMLIDADEQVTPALWNEIRDVLQSSKCAEAYSILKKFHFLGKRFRFGGFSHSAVCLFKTGRVRFEQVEGNSPNGQDMEVHERLLVDGKLGRLRNSLSHHDFKGLQAYLDRHNKYSTWEAGIRAHYLEFGAWGKQSIKASPFGDAQSFRRFVKAFLIRMPFEPWLWFFYHYFVRAGFLEGRRGFIASSFRKAYIEQVHAKIYERRIFGSTPR